MSLPHSIAAARSAQEPKTNRVAAGVEWAHFSGPKERTQATVNIDSVVMQKQVPECGWVSVRRGSFGL